MRLKNLAVHFFTLFFMAVPSWAVTDFPLGSFGNQVGNGGKIVVCRDASYKITWSKLLDFYEADAIYAEWGKPVLEGANYIEMALNAIERLKSYDQAKYLLYKQEISSFEAQSKWIKTPINDSHDSDELVAPPVGCAVEQLALQVQPALPGDRLINIVSEIWSKMSEEDRAGLVLHEVIYKDAIARGHQNSIAVRYLNALISTNEIMHWSQVEFQKLLHNAHLGTIRERENADKIEWVLIESLGVPWSKASKTCEYLEASMVPMIKDVEQSKQFLLDSEIGPLISREEVPESWTRERDVDSGLVYVHGWTAGDAKVVRRKTSDFVQILCLKHL